VTFDSGILCATVIGEASVLGLLSKRRLFRLLPIFSAYVVFSLASDLIGSLVFWRLSSLVYGRLYFTLTVLDALFQFGVLGELAWSVLRPVRNSLPRGFRGVLYIIVALAGAAIWPLAAVALPTAFTGLSAMLFHLEETFSILRVVCFLVMASLSQVLSIGWRDRELQVATGLGFYSIVSLLVTVLHSHQEMGVQYHWLDQAVSISYVGTMAYWVTSFATKEQERKEFSPQMQQLLVLMSGGARASRIALGDLPPEPSNKRIK
jgi:hypothetical protein